MKLYRYIPYRYWTDIVRKGFAARPVSAYEDIFEGVSCFGKGVRVAPTFYDQMYSIVCFNDPAVTSKKDEMQLWSRYADKGCGVRIVLDVPPAMIGRAMRLDRVVYDDNIGDIEDSEMELALHGEGAVGFECDFLLRALFTKGLSWEWEHEVRLLISNEEREGIVSHKKGVGAEPVPMFWYAEFLRGFITGVDFGPRINSLSIDSEVNAERMIADVKEIVSEGHKLDFGIMMCAKDRRQIRRVPFAEWMELWKRAKDIDLSMQNLNYDIRFG